MKRASYREGVEIIALNEDVDERDLDNVAGTSTVILLAELFGVDRERVARDVVKFREKHIEEAR